MMEDYYGHDPGCICIACCDADMRNNKSDNILRCNECGDAVSGKSICFDDDGNIYCNAECWGDAK